MDLLFVQTQLLTVTICRTTTQLKRCSSRRTVTVTHWMSCIANWRRTVSVHTLSNLLSSTCWWRWWLWIWMILLIIDNDYYHTYSLYIKCSKVSVMYVHNGGRGQLSSEWRHNENDMAMTIAGLWRYGDWQRGHGLHHSSNTIMTHWINQWTMAFFLIESH